MPAPTHLWRILRHISIMGSMGFSGSRSWCAFAALLGVGLSVPVPASTAANSAGPADQLGEVTAAPTSVQVRRLNLRAQPWALSRGATGTMRTTLYPGRFNLAAVTWTGRLDLDLRARDSRAWTSWQPVERLPGANPTGAATHASDLMWLGDATAVQLRTAGTVPGRAQLVLLSSPPEAADTAATSSALEPRQRSALRAAPAPPLYKRSDWGANPQWRNGTPRYSTQLKQVHVHHTATGNEYRRRDVPAILRAIYRYHTKTLGWFDIGYNFLIDRFGRTWVGRSGGPARLVRGAHTLGFNSRSVGVAVLGNTETAAPTQEAVRSLIRLAAWKLDMYDRQAVGTVWVRSEGSDLFPSGTRVRLPVIDGHRDTNGTACPGESLYLRLPQIRERVQQRITRW